MRVSLAYFFSAGGTRIVFGTLCLHTSDLEESNHMRSNLWFASAERSWLTMAIWFSKAAQRLFSQFWRIMRMWLIYFSRLRWITRCLGREMCFTCRDMVCLLSVLISACCSKSCTWSIFMQFLRDFLRILSSVWFWSWMMVVAWSHLSRAVVAASLYTEQNEGFSMYNRVITNTETYIGE